MIKSISNIFELDKIIRKYLISQSELDPRKVINSLSVRGPELQVLVEKNTYVSPDLNTTILIFENTNNDTNNNVSVPEEDGTFSIYQSFSCKIILYGNYSKTLGLILKSRMESEVIRQNLFDEGINIEKVTSPVSLNEFKNETVWIRTDLSIEYSCRMSVQPVNELNEMDNISKIKIIKEE